MREKVNAALRKKAVRGEVLGRPPYGYKVGSRNRLEVVDDEAVVVRYIYRLYLQEDLGIRLIARRLNEEGLRTRRNRPGAWSASATSSATAPTSAPTSASACACPAPTPPSSRPRTSAASRSASASGARTTRRARSAASCSPGMLICGYCGNRLIGVSRKQTWTRRRDGSEQVASYRYYQCESRTNQGICSYHTQRAEELEKRRARSALGARPHPARRRRRRRNVIGQWQAEMQAPQGPPRHVDRRLSRYLEQASSARAKATACARRASSSPRSASRSKRSCATPSGAPSTTHSAAERRRTRNAALDLLVSQWENLPLSESQQLLKELVENVRVTDDEVSLTLRP